MGKVIKLCVSLMSMMGMSNAEEMLYQQLKQSSSSFDNISDDENEPLSQHQPVDISEYEKITKSNKGHSIKHHELQSEDEVLAELDHSRHFIAMELEERDTEQLKMQIRSEKQHNLPRILRKAPKIKEQNEQHKQIHHSIKEHNIAGNVMITHSHQNEEHNVQRHASVCGAYWNKIIFPFHFLFKYTIPRTNNDSTTSRLSIGFFLVLVWLGILTFICVDSAEKMGNCLRISEDVMGLTLLAIGSSLPDCFSSVLAAKQGKGEMAVSNALGSNVFDINICIGCSFLLKSTLNKFNGITVERTSGFNLFIIALFVLLAIFMFIMFYHSR